MALAFKICQFGYRGGDNKAVDLLDQSQALGNIDKNTGLYHVTVFIAQADQGFVMGDPALGDVQNRLV